jgi:hypothetical protein
MMQADRNVLVLNENEKEDLKIPLVNMDKELIRNLEDCSSNFSSDEF